MAKAPSPDITGEFLGYGPAIIAVTLPRPIVIALYAYAEKTNHKAETIVAEALRAYMGDAA